MDKFILKMISIRRQKIASPRNAIFGGKRNQFFKGIFPVQFSSIVNYWANIYGNSVVMKTLASFCLSYDISRCGAPLVIYSLLLGKSPHSLHNPKGNI